MSLTLTGLVRSLFALQVANQCVLPSRCKKRVARACFYSQVLVVPSQRNTGPADLIEEEGNSERSEVSVPWGHVGGVGTAAWEAL